MKKNNKVKGDESIDDFEIIEEPTTEPKNKVIQIAPKDGLGAKLINLLMARKESRYYALESITGSSMDKSSDEVKRMRETEASILRGVIQEQEDLIEIIKMLPDAS